MVASPAQKVLSSTPGAEHAGTKADSATPAAEPFLKWAGGKRRLVEQLRPLLPPGVSRRRHLEPFFGGGALFFAQRPERAVLSDLNGALIHTYTVVRDRVGELIKSLQRLAQDHSKERYYALRARYNSGALSQIEQAAAFVYLNRTCFNGLHRVNRKGAFNVPMGRYDNPRIVHAEGLVRASAALQGAELRHAPFEEVLETAHPGDFVYFDPPYVPLSASANFTSYAVDDFGHADQERLRDVFAVLDRRGCRVMLSNSDTPDARVLYRGFQIDRVAAPRLISCNGRTRTPVTELVVRNYR